MSGKTKIEWADRVWNPIVGCSVVSAGCTNCYAMRQAARWRNDPASVYHGLTRHRPGKGAAWTGAVRAAPPHTLYAPLYWKQPSRVFVNSMGDLFHESIQEQWLMDVFDVMFTADEHLFMILTKRSDRMRAWIAANPKMRQLRNVWLGVSVEDQATADARIPDLLATPAAGRFISAEPLLGPVDLTRLHYDDIAEIDALNGWTGLIRPLAGRTNRLDLVICGGESGPGARPMHPAWPRAIRDQCAAAGVAFNFKQWGDWAKHKVLPGGDLGGDVRRGRVQIVHPGGETEIAVAAATGGRSTLPGSTYMARVGKRAAGRTLDGRTHDAVAPLPLQETAS